MCQLTKKGGNLMENKTYGYIRVSSKEQNEDRQRIALLDFGVPQKNIYMDKQSGKDFERPQYRKLVKRLKQGDTLVVKSIDRLGRNYAEIIEQWRVITKDKKINIVVLDISLLDTRQCHDLLGTFIADLTLQILSYVAQAEREFNHQRQAEGIAAAKARGVKFGGTPKKRPLEFNDVLKKWKDGKISARKAAKLLDVTHPTFLKWAKE